MWPIGVPICQRRALPASQRYRSAESKSGAVVREHLGSAQISPHGAGLVNDFCANYLSPYVNFHHMCFFLEAITDAKGKGCRRGRYEEMKTLL